MMKKVLIKDILNVKNGFVSDTEYVKSKFLKPDIKMLKEEKLDGVTNMQELKICVVKDLAGW